MGQRIFWQLYEKAHTPFSWHSSAFKIAKKFNRQLFSSPFSTRNDLLEKFNVQLYKLASFEITDFKLIKYIAKKQTHLNFNWNFKYSRN